MDEEERKETDKFVSDLKKMIIDKDIQTFELNAKEAASNGHSEFEIYVTPMGYAAILERYATTSFHFEVCPFYSEPTYERINFFQKRRTGIKYVPDENGQIGICVTIE